MNRRRTSLAIMVVAAAAMTLTGCDAALAGGPVTPVATTEQSRTLTEMGGYILVQTVTLPNGSKVYCAVVSQAITCDWTNAAGAE